MIIAPNSYVIGNDGKSNFLMQVSSVGDDTVYGHLDKGRAYAPKQAEFSMRNIVAVLGLNPPPGNAYGCLIEPFRRTIQHDLWGNVHLHRKLSKEERINLKKALTDVGRLLEKKKLAGFIEAGNLETEIRPPKGRYTGMYHYVIKKGEDQDRMVLRPKEGVPMDYVIAHESGHGVWYRLMNDALKAKWVKLYHSYTKMQEFAPHDIRKLRDNYIKDSVPVKEFRGQLPEEQVLLFDNLISGLRSNTRLTVKHLDLLADNGALKTIEDMWPLHVEDSDFEIALTEYGTTNPEEFFAESFAYWLLGRVLPKRVGSYMENTVKAIV